MSFDLTDADRAAAVALLERLRASGLKLAAAESCTGGLIAALLTSVPGSSDVFERGFVTYSNEAKSQLLGVPADLITAKGAVSEEVARAMAEGTLRHSRAQLAVAVTGVAGPGGGSPAKPVGLVHIAIARTEHGTRHERLQLGDIGRDQVRAESLRRVLALAAALLDA